jgi:phosphatidylglycerophosphatase A
MKKSIATAAGIGFIGKGAGTAAAVVYCTIVFFAAAHYTALWQLLLLAVTLIAGVWSAGVVEKEWGHDNNKIVIDEVAGMMITLLFVPLTIKYILTGLVLFRFFDIVKPLGIRKAESLPGGWGVMADDVLAGSYAWLLLQLIIAAKVF